MLTAALDYEPAPGFEYDHLEEQWDSEDSTEFRNLSPRTYSRHVRMGIAPGFEDVEVWVDSEDLSEEDSQSSQAGLSRHRASSESAGLRLDGKTPFLWQLVLFFLPDWLPEPVAEQYRVRLSVSVPSSHLMIVTRCALYEKLREGGYHSDLSWHEQEGGEACATYAGR